MKITIDEVAEAVEDLNLINDEETAPDIVVLVDTDDE